MTPHSELSAAAGDVETEPEHRGDRRRFLIFALMAGLIPPERVTERVIADAERAATEQDAAA